MRPSLMCLLLVVMGPPAASLNAQQQRDTFPLLHAVNPANFDTACTACHDFFGYVNGGWDKRTEIPAIYTFMGVDRDVGDRTEALLHHVLEIAKAAAPTTTNLDTRLVGYFYGSCLDTTLADSVGTAPLASYLALIDSMRTLPDLVPALVGLHLQGSGALFNFGAEQDDKNSSQMIAAVTQGGLGLPNRDFYTLTDSTSRDIRDEYVTHITHTFVLLGESPVMAAQHATKVMVIETALANVSLTPTEQRDPNAVYHKMAVAGLQQLAPAFNWVQYLRAMGVPTVQSLNVGMPNFVRGVNALLTNTPIDDWRAYLRWRIIDESSPMLSTPFVRENFQFASLLRGTHQLLPRWKRCMDATDNALGEALGREYVKTAFPPQAKGLAVRMVNNLEATMRDRILALPWMGDSTKRQALVKLAAITNKIGYPDRWRDYAALTLAPTVYARNGIAAGKFETRRQLNKIDKPVDRTEWDMTPPTNNAYYNPSSNEIVFPAGILQPPYFDPHADDASNYGAIGSIIGHEMTHAFDDQGRQFDAVGNLRDWWTSQDAASFMERAQVVVDEYNGFIVVDTIHVNGKLSLGENIADIGGLKVAYDAFEHAMQGKPRTRIGGFTPEQRFFIAYAEAWRTKVRPETERTRAISDPHSPARWRVNGVVANMPEFARAFGCKAGDPMVRPPRQLVQIW